MMLRRTFRPNVAFLPALLLFSACGGTDPEITTIDDQQVNLDVVNYAADATTDDIALMTTSADEALRPDFPTRAGCTRVGLFRVQCPRRTFADDVTFTRDVTFYDAAGEEMEFFHRDSTAAVNIVVSFQGSRSRADREISINRESDMTVSGLLGAEQQRTWNGFSTASENRARYSDEFGDRVYNMSSNSSVKDVVVAVPHAGTWPISGTITRQVTVEIVSGSGDPVSRTRTVVIEFNGTQFVTITVNGEEFTFDLETRTVVQGDAG